MEKQVQAMDTLFVKTQKLAEDLDEQMIQNDSLTKEMQRLEGEVKIRDNQLTGLANDKAGVQRRLDREKKQVEIFRQRVADAKTSRDILQTEINGLRKDLEISARREDELSKQICMHIAATEPKSIDIDSLENSLVLKEKEIYKDQLKSSGKPDDIIEKIIDGKIKKFKFFSSL